MKLEESHYLQPKFNRVLKISEAVGQSDGSLEVNLSSKAGLRVEFHIARTNSLSNAAIFYVGKKARWTMDLLVSSNKGIGIRLR